MTGKIHIDVERCKGCGLCLKVCLKGGIVISEQSNKKGYFPAKPSDNGCTGCAMCALVCPDAVIEVVREDSNRIKAVPASGGGSKPEMVKERK